MSSIILPSRWTSQPQGPVEVDHSSVSGQIIIASRPGVMVYDPASLVTPSILGTAPSAEYRRVTQDGLAVEVHPNGGASGIGVLAWPSATIPNETSELTLIWVGTPKNLSTDNGQAFVRGHDGGGGGWSISAIFASSTSLTFNVVSLTPTAGYTATITDSFSTTQPERIAYRLSGGVLTGFHHRSRKSSSTAIGANLRGTADSLLRLGGHSSTLTGGHNICNGFIAIRGRLTDVEVWDLLDRPWQIFKKRPNILYFDVGGGGGITGTGTLTSSAITASGSGVLSHTGTGTLTTGVTTLSGTGTLTHTGTGALTTGITALSGTGILTHTGTGALTVGTVTLSGTGSVSPTGAITGTGALTLANVTASGSGTLAHIGTGGLTANVVTLSGAGKLTHSGTGDLTTNVVTLSGSGFLGSGIFGSGSLTIGNVTVTATGTWFGWTQQGASAGVWTDAANTENYAFDDYVEAGYVESGRWSIQANAVNTWTIH
jgi:hypothetical protein